MLPEELAQSLGFHAWAPPYRAPGLSPWCFVDHRPSTFTQVTLESCSGGYYASHTGQMITENDNKRWPTRNQADPDFCAQLTSDLNQALMYQQHEKSRVRNSTSYDIIIDFRMTPDVVGPDK